MTYDDIDKKLIEELIEDGRMSYVELAKKVGLSRVAVKDRIQNLIDKGVIEHFTVAINSEKFGKKVSAFFEVDVEPNQVLEVARNLADHPNVASIYQMTGPRTLHMHGLVEDCKKVETFSDNILYSVQAIARVNTR